MAAISEWLRMGFGENLTATYEFTKFIALAYIFTNISHRRIASIGIDCFRKGRLGVCIHPTDPNYLGKDVSQCGVELTMASVIYRPM